MMMNNLLLRKIPLIILGVFLSVSLADANHINVPDAGGDDSSGSGTSMLISNLDVEPRANITPFSSDLNYRYIYDADNGLDGTTITIDLSKVDLPAGVINDSNTTFSIDSILNGKITQGASPYLFKFYPKTDSTDPTLPAPGILGNREKTRYHISYPNGSGGTITVDGDIYVTVVSTKQPPMGQIDESVLNCFTSFEAVTFKAGVKYYTGNTAINPSGAANYTDGFSIPLVGDLNGDGKPEIVAMSQQNNAAEGYSDYLYIFNGQTGKIIIKHTLPVRQSNRAGGYHGTPSQIALVDADMNGRGEIILAMGYHLAGANSQWDKRLICYEVNDKTFTTEGISGTTATAADRLTMKWVSNRRYDWTEVNSLGTTANSYYFSYDSGGTTKTVLDNTGYSYNALYYFSTPMPQIVDFDGDGVPEIYVYNKIYNATNGELIMKFEELGPANSLTGNYVDANYASINSYAFVGRDRTARNSGGVGAGDTNVPFAFIYDVDKDGVYDIAAGGKLYYKINLAAKTYSVIKNVPTYPGSTSYLIDGHTGVADINSDGIPDIVVLTRTPGNTAGTSPLILTVWNPGFFQLAADGVTVIPGTGVPEVIARIDIPVSLTTYGNHSYVYISDIDGLVQEVNLPGGGTVKKKFPEISVLSGRMYGAPANNIPLHPNVAATLGPKLANGTGGKYIAYGGDGSLISFTWDGNATTYNNRLKASFVLLHTDNSNNTAFTLFDFDNDGKMDICYRDYDRLRIISAEAPYYVNSTDATPAQNPLIKFAMTLPSHTGFECPVIADIDGDSSADMIVMGKSTRDYWNYVYAIQGDGVQFAPAPKVWNQFMYTPLKINEDLTVPARVFDPLSSEFAYSKQAVDGYVKDYIYNNTITQTTMFSTFKKEVNGKIYDVWEPIVKQPDAVVTAKILLTPSNSLQITIKNTGSATLNATNPIVIYQAVKGAELNASNYFGRTTVGADLFPGEERVITYPISNPNLDYVIRVSDASYLTGSFVSGMWETTYLECDWASNIAYASSFQANDDVFVIEPYKTIIFNVMSNDDTPTSCTPTASFTLPSGTDWGSATTGFNGLVVYTAPATYPGGVVEFSYNISCGSDSKTAKVYIYILENTSGSFATCYGSDIAIKLKEQPTGTTFNWYSDANGTTPIAPPTTISNLTTARTYYVQPKVPTPYNTVNFPLYKLVVEPIGNGTDNVNMRWTGNISSDWNNPNNWVLLNGNTESATTYAPAKCVDIEIPKGKTNYPSLNSNGAAGFIAMGDRAMIANTHKLDYDSASVEINFNASERDRWVMYSAPLRKTYSGDFILRTAAGEPIIKPDPSTYMNYFQVSNPERPEMVATARAFTKPVGSVEIALPLGKSFNVWLDSDADASTPFQFPSPIDQYTLWVHGPWGGTTGDSISSILDRTDRFGEKVNGRFIIEDATPAANGSFTIAPPDDQPGFSLLMLPNPFMAYLDMDVFLMDNISVLNTEYKVWSGINDSFISYKLVQGYNYQYWWVTDNPNLNDLGSYQYLSPLQSFIVSKNAASINSRVNITYKPETATTTQRVGSGDYQLRNIETTPEGVITIKATVGDHSNSTVLVNSPVSTNWYDEQYDALKLFYDNEDGKQQVSIYTLTPDEEIPLAINSANDFRNLEIPLGVRSNVQGTIQFDFSGVDYFGVTPIYLKDGNKQIDITNNPVYSTTISGSKGFYEINDRFKLSFPRNTVGAEEENTDNAVNITVKNSKIYITSGDMMENIEVVSSVGAKVFQSDKPTLSQTIEVQAAQVYIVRVKTDKDTVIKKVIVK